MCVIQIGLREHELRGLRLRLQTEDIDGDESIQLEHKLQEFQQQAPLLESLQRELSSAQVCGGCVEAGIGCVKEGMGCVHLGSCGLNSGVVLYLMGFFHRLVMMLEVWKCSRKAVNFDFDK